MIETINTDNQSNGRNIQPLLYAVANNTDSLKHKYFFI